MGTISTGIPASPQATNVRHATSLHSKGEVEQQE
jgi:hypothetical protein